MFVVGGVEIDGLVDFVVLISSVEEKVSTLFNNVVSLVRAMKVESPASKEGQIVDGGFLSNVTKSVAV